MVASGGGHLTQLKLLQDRLRPPAEDPIWVTYRLAQTQSLLTGEEVYWGFHPTTRSLKNAARNYALARRLFADHHIVQVVSTGAALAVPFMVRARQSGVPCHYIESATRVSEPSVSGRILERVPGVRLYAQYADWERRRWGYAGSVFDGFRRQEDARLTPPIRSAFVSLGTQRYSFDALVARARNILRDVETVVWQLGATAAPAHLAGEVHRNLPAGQQEALLAESDVVIGHCGTGLALSALHAGKVPILVPRRAAEREHVDDHQRATAAELRDRGLAVVRDVDNLDETAIEEAARASVRHGYAPPLRLA